MQEVRQSKDLGPRKAFTYPLRPIRFARKLSINLHLMLFRSIVSINHGENSVNVEVDCPSKICGEVAVPQVFDAEFLPVLSYFSETGRAWTADGVEFDDGLERSQLFFLGKPPCVFTYVLKRLDAFNVLQGDFIGS
jgi:hypothetical protein